MSSDVAVIVLAAGRSQRMGSRNKLLLPIDGRTIIEHAVEAAVRSSIGPVILVVGAEGEQIGNVLKRHPIRLITNRAYEEGMASSIRTGVGAAGSTCTGYAICPGDMPRIQSSTFQVLARTLKANPEHIVLPQFEGQTGHPVLFGRRYYRSLLQLEGDVGARSIIVREMEAVRTVTVLDAGIHRDVDTEDDWRRLDS